MLDMEIYGLDPAGFHLTNLALHLANVLLFYLLLLRMTGSLWPSVLAAALFALHPLHVESVAWIAERKDVLSTFFWMLTCLAYVRYTAAPGLGRYALVFFCLALGLMSKPMLVTLPLVLLLLDFWPLGRLGPDGGAGWRPAAGRLKSLLWEKVPLLSLSAASALVTLWAQKAGGSLKTLDVYPFGVRAANAVLAYAGYVGKLVFPKDLAVLYPHPGRRSPGSGPYGRRGPGRGDRAGPAGGRASALPAVGWLWYLGTLVPVIGLVQVGQQAMADRYAYVPALGLYILAAWGAADLAARFKPRPAALAAGALIVLALLGLRTHRQLGYWKDSRILAEHALAVAPVNPSMHYNLGVYWTKAGRYEEAVRHYRLAVRQRPGYAKAHINLGNLLALRGRSGEARRHLTRALEIAPGGWSIHMNLGALAAREGKFDLAETHFRRAVGMQPASAMARNYLGQVLAVQGRMKEAIDQFRRAVALDPKSEPARANLKRALAARGGRGGGP